MPLYSQAQFICGNSALSIKERQQMVDAIYQYETKVKSPRLAVSINYFPIKVHIVRTDNGNALISWNTVVQQVARLNQYYLKAGIQFYFCETNPNYINSDKYYDQSSQQSNVLELELVSKYGVTNAINLFIIHNLFDTVGGEGLFTR